MTIGVVENDIHYIFRKHLVNMDPAIIYGIVGVCAFLLLYFRGDKSIDLKKVTTKRPVIKFRLYHRFVKIADKQTQTDKTPSSSPPPTPMSCLSSDSDFPFNFDEDYLNGSHLLSRNSGCELRPIVGTTVSSGILGITTDDETEPLTRPLST